MPEPFILDLGFDRGNERTKVAHMTMQGNFLEYEDSSAIDTIDAEEFSRLMAGTRTSNNDASIGMISTFQDRTYVLGSLARQQKKNASTDIGNRRRYYDTRTLVSLLSHASAIMRQNYPSITTLHLSVVTSLPIQTYDNDIIREIKRAFNGTHRIQCNERDYTFTVNIAEVLMEGTGAAITHGGAGHYALIDGGRLTHNIMIFNDMSAIAEMCHTLEIGVQNIADKTRALFYKAHKRKLTPMEMESILWAYSNRQEMPPIFNLIDRERIAVPATTLKGYVAQAIQEVGDDLRAKITEKWSDETGNIASGISKVIYAGGAALYLKSEVEELLGTVEVPEFTQRANARGNATRALAIRLSAPRTGLKVF